MILLRLGSLISIGGLTESLYAVSESCWKKGTLSKAKFIGNLETLSFSNSMPQSKHFKGALGFEDFSIEAI